MKNLKIAQDSKHKWNIINTTTNEIVAGHFVNKTLALEVMKNYKKLVEPSLTATKNSKKMSRKDQIRHARAKKQGISYSDYVSKYCVGG